MLHFCLVFGFAVCLFVSKSSCVLSPLCKQQQKKQTRFLSQDPNLCKPQAFDCVAESLSSNGVWRFVTWFAKNYPLNVWVPVVQKLKLLQVKTFILIILSILLVLEQKIKIFGNFFSFWLLVRCIGICGNGNGICGKKWTGNWDLEPPFRTVIGGCCRRAEGAMLSGDWEGRLNKEV